MPTTPTGIKTKADLNLEQALALKHGRRLLNLGKGYFLPAVARLACHHIFKQIFNLFDLPIAHDRLGEEQFRQIALFDVAYVLGYKWLIDNPELATLFNEQIITPFASHTAIELHKDSFSSSP